MFIHHTTCRSRRGCGRVVVAIALSLWPSSLHPRCCGCAILSWPLWSCKFCCSCGCGHVVIVAVIVMAVVGVVAAISTCSQACHL